MNRVCLILVGLCFAHASHGQELDSLPPRYVGEHHDELTLLVGYQQGRYGFAEIGVGRNQYGSNHHPYDIAYYIGTELRVDRPGLMGVKAGAYVDGGFAMGVQLIQYFDGPDHCTVLRPEMGIGFFKFKLTYAYNVRLTSPRIDGVNTHMLNLSYAFRLKRLPRDDDPRAIR